jgi:hypothetical protein
MNREITIAAVTVFTLVGFLPDANADAASVEAVIGKTWNFKQGKITGTITYTTSTVEATFGGKTYPGTLRVNGDRLCTKYPEIKKGAETCFGISKTTKGYKTTHGATLWQ